METDGGVMEMGVKVKKEGKGGESVVDNGKPW